MITGLGDGDVPFGLGWRIRTPVVFPMLDLLDRFLHKIGAGRRPKLILLAKSLHPSDVRNFSHEAYASRLFIRCKIFQSFVQGTRGTSACRGIGLAAIIL